MNVHELKAEIKAQAIKIKEQKKLLRHVQRTTKYGGSGEMMALHYMREYNRFQFCMYAFLRGLPASHPEGENNFVKRNPYTAKFHANKFFNGDAEKVQLFLNWATNA